MIDVVIDISHHNGTNLSFAKAKGAGIEGVIHKASQGSSNVDPLYKTNRKKAAAAGLMWGAYHFATGSGGVGQAMSFLKAVGDPAEVLMVLDLEPNPNGPSMGLIEARNFVSFVHHETGRWPGLYSGHTIRELLQNSDDPVLANCWLWLAQYGPIAVVPPNWPTWTMWQYTDGMVGKPPPVPGIGHCDRNRFNGSLSNLRKLWGVA